MPTQSRRLDRVFHALAHPIRRALLVRLAGGDQRVTTLAGPFAMSLAAISKHLKVLEGASLVRRTWRGREALLSLELDALCAAEEWIAQHRAL